MEERESRARRTVNKYMGFSAGVGLLPLPFLNTAGITAIRLRMLQVPLESYDVPFSRDLGKKIIGSLLGSIVPTSLSGTSGGVAGLFAFDACGACGRVDCWSVDDTGVRRASTYTIGQILSSILNPVVRSSILSQPKFESTSGDGLAEDGPCPGGM
jgi:uncharacterized protein (DUF697 family)